MPRGQEQEQGQGRAGSIKKTGATRRGQTTKANKFFRDTQTKAEIQINENIKFNNERARTKTIKDKGRKHKISEHTQCGKGSAKNNNKPKGQISYALTQLVLVYCSGFWIFIPYF